MIILLIWLAVLIAVIAIYFRQFYSRFRKYGVKYEKPIPIFGNTARILLRVDHVADNLVNFYNKFPEERFIGRFEFTNEIVIIRDLDLVKLVAVKDFDYFLDHRSAFSESDSFFARNLFSLTGQEWKDMRSTLSPAFTSSKIRAMVPFMMEVGDQMISMLKRKMKESKEGYLNVDCKDLTTRYTCDVIASCAFGLKVDSHMNPENEFYARAKELTNFGFRQMIKIFTMINLPKVAKFLKWDFPPERSKEFFSTLFTTMMKERELKQIVRPDMIHLLLEAKKGRLTHENIKAEEIDAGFATVKESVIGKSKINRDELLSIPWIHRAGAGSIVWQREELRQCLELAIPAWSDQDLIAQAMLFFVAGYETVSAGMCFLLYELAVNPDIQDRLAKEIRDQDDRNGGKFDFNSIQEMIYLDMVISELLRLWPPAIALDRTCLKDYNLGKPNQNSEKDFIIRKGTAVAIPVFAFHRDSNYFPNPKKFDPERFSEKNRHKLHPLAYMPFGIGPRNCIGSRFALCEMKVMTYQILLHMEVFPSATTCIPAELSTESFNIRLKGGSNFKFKLRNN